MPNEKNLKRYISNINYMKAQDEATNSNYNKEVKVARRGLTGILAIFQITLVSFP